MNANRNRSNVSEICHLCMKEQYSTKGLRRREMCKGNITEIRKKISKNSVLAIFLSLQYMRDVLRYMCLTIHRKILLRNKYMTFQTDF
jgi:hypothetical protein